MSYDLYIYHRELKTHADCGRELDESERPPLTTDDMSRFVGRLEKYGYRLYLRNPGCDEYIKEVAGCPIQVLVFSGEIAFNIPYWPNVVAAVAEALQDATELCDSDTMVVYDPQTDRWGN